MSDNSDTVKVIIEIPKDMYTRCKEYKLWSYDAETLEGAVATSKPLSEVLSENKSEWIPVSERLPKIADVYRVTRRLFDNRIDTEPFYMVDACFFDGTNTWHNDNRINRERAYVDDVIAWQENPEPYKAER